MECGLPKSALDHESPYFKPFSPFWGWRGLFYRIKISRSIEPCCDIEKSLLEIPIFPFAECTLYAHHQVSVCRVQGVIHLYAPQTGLFLFTLRTAENKKSCQKALLPRPSDDYRVQNKNASIVSILTFLYGGEGEIRTLAPR